MGCPSSIVLGQTLIFTVCTHNPDTSAVSDADSPPAYRLYENTDDTALLTGAMTKRDDANTTGYYTGSIVCSTANGFETNKTYSIHISALVGGVAGAISFEFEVRESAVGAGANSFTITVRDPEGNPEDGVSVWITTDSNGVNVIRSGTTNDLGTVTFLLDAGSYYAWAQEAGINFPNGTLFTVP